MVNILTNNGENQNFVKFKATIRSQKRITVPKNIVGFNEGDKVIVIVKRMEAEV